MTKRAVTLAVAAVLALAVQPALAQRSRGGGHSGGGHSGGGGHPSGGGRVSGGGHPGGGHAGGGYAVPRGAGRSYVPGGVAQARHPRAGGAYYGHGSSGYGHGHYPAYGHGHYPAYGYGHYYRPYYGGYYPYYGGSYYGSSFGLSFGFGWPYGYANYGWPYGWYGDSYGYASAPTTNVYVAPSEPSSGEEARGSESMTDERPGTRDSYVPNTGRVRLEVRPEDASVYVDDEFWGPASDSRLMTLRAGRHAIELVRPGFGVVRRELDVTPGQTTDVLVELQRP